MYDNIQANIFTLHTPLTLGVGSKGKNLVFFSEGGHVAYQIKGNEVYNSITACKQIFALTHTESLGWGQKVKTFF